MPRAKKTLAGQPGQAAEPIKGQTYGVAKQLGQLQESMPAPQANQPVSSPRQSASQIEAEPETPRMSLADAMGMVQGQGGILSAPDDNPSIPVTDGLSQGPGRGPEVMQTSSALGNTLRRLAMQTQDPVFLELASKVRI